MPLTPLELFSDAPAIAATANAFDSAIKALKVIPNPKAADWAKAFGFGGIVLSACQAFDSIHAGPVTVDQVATVMGVDPAGPTGKLLRLAETIIAQAND